MKITDRSFHFIHSLTATFFRIIANVFFYLKNGFIKPEKKTILFSTFALLLILLSSIANTTIAETLVDSTLLPPRIIDRIIITGNKKTKTRIITRELLFNEGDTLNPLALNSAIESSKKNLLNIGLFNFVDVFVYQGLLGHIEIQIEVTERWYLFPFPVFDIADRNFNEWWLKRDFNRVNYGLRVSQENFRGRDEVLQLQMIFGYSQRLGIYYTIPYINRKQNIGLTMAVYGTRNHETNYDTENNKILFYKNINLFVKNDLQGYLRITKRKGISSYFSTTFDFRTTSVTDSVITLNPDFFITSNPIQNHLGLSWSYIFDKRDYRAYAMKGFFLEVEASKVGLGILNNEPNLIELELGVRKYQPISKRFNAQASIKLRAVQKTGAPYFNQRALGYSSDYIRGYDFYVINGQDFALTRTNIRYSLMQTKVYQLPVINSNKFKKVPLAIYLNGFFDSGNVVDNQFGYKNSLSNSWQYGYGVGLDIVTYYDLVFRFELVRNRMNENGLFFHIGTAI